jgi:hypothetical protein
MTADLDSSHKGVNPAPMGKWRDGVVAGYKAINAEMVGGQYGWCGRTPEHFVIGTEFKHEGGTEAVDYRHKEGYLRKRVVIKPDAEGVYLSRARAMFDGVRQAYHNDDEVMLLLLKGTLHSADDGPTKSCPEGCLWKITSLDGSPEEGEFTFTAIRARHPS